MFKNTSKLVLYCFLIVVAINLIVAYMVVTYVNFGQDPSGFQRQLLILGLIGTIWMLAGLGLTMKAIIKKEPFDLRFKLSAAGLVLLLLFSIVTGFLQ